MSAKKFLIVPLIVLTTCSLQGGAKIIDDPVIHYYGRIPTDAEVDVYWQKNNDPKKKIQYYYPTGVLKHRYNSGGLCGSIFGVEENYNKDGLLVRWIDHKNNEQSCSTGYSIKTVKKYKDGILAESFFLKIGNDSTEACKCGKWVTYNQGKPTKTKNYPLCTSMEVTDQYCYELK